jgi:hypothetical protein
MAEKLRDPGPIGEVWEKPPVSTDVRKLSTIEAPKMTTEAMSTGPTFWVNFVQPQAMASGAENAPDPSGAGPGGGGGGGTAPGVSGAGTEP